MVLLIITGILFAGYSILVCYYWWSWTHIPEFTPSQDPANIRVSVVIPARNEEHRIGNLLQALSEQDYPAGLYEVIVVDDHSEDRTAEIAARYPGVRVISLKTEAINSYKKKALETGIAAATGLWIVATDADCVPAESWLKTLAACAKEKNALFIAAPVYMSHDHSVLQVFQSMDFMILQAITGAVVQNNQLTMCNGANIAYRKDVFEEVGGFKGIDDIASGDDMLLMYKIWNRYPDQVVYLRSQQSVVTTNAEPTWIAFFRQRIRWASKAARYTDKRFFPVLLGVYLFNFSLFSLVPAGIWNPDYWKWFGIFWIAKTIVELPLFLSAARFFRAMPATPWFFFLQPLHILYITVSGLFGQFGKYEWKGRQVK
ncbi:MAG: glycosyltransferase [Chitinophagaceae bacterium]